MNKLEMEVIDLKKELKKLKDIYTKKEASLKNTINLLMEENEKMKEELKEIRLEEMWI